jgi:acyl-coenzyme A synthetase/AMP-(fatty) acid ligase
LSDSLDIDLLIDRLADYGDIDFLKTDHHVYTYTDLHAAIVKWQSEVDKIDHSGGSVGLVADYSLAGISALIALWSRRTCVALVPRHAADDISYQKAGHLDSLITVAEDDSFTIRNVGPSEGHPLLEELAARGNPGLILFSSGSSGEPKAVLHDFNRFVVKFNKPGKRLSTYAFLVFDHVAGQDTLLYTLNAGGCLVAGSSRRPETVARLIEKHDVEVLPASPTFLNLLLASGVGSSFDFSSVRIITYGSEPMDPGTLRRLTAAFPAARIIQKYGTSEFGAIRSKSKDNDSLFIEIKEDETRFRIEDGILWIKSPSAMMGYLNAPSSLKDGWVCTGDMVEQDGKWLRILGRESDLINVGGEKVIPARVESVIQQLDFVADVVVKGERHPLTGMIVVAEITLSCGDPPTEPAERRKLVKTIRQHCMSQLPKYEVPVSINFATSPSTTDRQKKIRR